MEIKSIYDEAFKPFGRVLSDVPAELTEPVVAAMREHIALPEGTAYGPSEPALEALEVAPQLGALFFGGLSYQLGCVRGHNTKLNCLEYHRSSEFNLGTDDFILLLAHQWELDVDAEGNPVLDTNKVKAFRAPAGVLIEVYATSLHYTPCHADAAHGFKVLVALPKGTNELVDDAANAALAPVADMADARMLRKANKWLFAHPEAKEASDGGYVGLAGTNWDIAE